MIAVRDAYGADHKTLWMRMTTLLDALTIDSNPDKPLIKARDDFIAVATALRGTLLPSEDAARLPEVFHRAVQSVRDDPSSDWTAAVESADRLHRRLVYQTAIECFPGIEDAYRTARSLGLTDARPERASAGFLFD